jgi:hypothetical protein
MESKLAPANFNATSIVPNRNAAPKINTKFFFILTIIPFAVLKAQN